MASFKTITAKYKPLKRYLRQKARSHKGFRAFFHTLRNVKIKRYFSPGSTLAIFCISPQIFKSRSGFPLISASALRLWSFYTKNTQKLLLRVAVPFLTICTKNDIISLQVQLKRILPEIPHLCRKNQKDCRKCDSQIVHSCAVGGADDFEIISYSR